MRNRIAIVVIGIAVGLGMRMIREPELRSLLPSRGAARQTSDHGPASSTGNDSKEPREVELGP